MSVPHRTHKASAAPAIPQAQTGPLATPPATTQVPHTRTGSAWLAICAIALGFVVLIIFMLQNTRSTEVSFLWMQGTLPLALALLIASVGAALLTMVIGTARITQLRRLSRRHRP
jgi:putative membrane protein